MIRAKLRSRPMLFLSGFGWAILLLVLLPGVLLPVSRMAFNPGEAVVTREGVVLARTFPGDALSLPRPQISYHEVIRPLTAWHNGGHPCEQRGGPRQYTSVEPVGTWSLDWSAACTDDPAGFEWSAAWTWHIGALRLPPVWAHATVLAAY